jgi:flagellar hook assembly protein FlgD
VAVDQVVQIRIHDIQGRTIRTLVDRHLPAGTHVVSWDGRGEQGSPLPAGVYFIRMAAGGRTVHRKVHLKK